MAFRVKDLLINVLPPETGKDGGDADGPGWPDCGCTLTLFCGCSGTPTIPPVCYCGAPLMTPPMPHCMGTPTPPHCMGTPTVHWTPWQYGVHGADPTAAAKQLSAMKAQLKQSLSEIEQHEQHLAEKQQPQTIEEIEALQGKLREAHDELEQRKSKLKQQ